MALQVLLIDLAGNCCVVATSIRVIVFATIELFEVFQLSGEDCGCSSGVVLPSHGSCVEEVLEGFRLGYGFVDAGVTKRCGFTE